jgi:tetratricopeptide (TPR) repeat protein
LALGQTQPEFAISDYGKAIELDPKYVGSYINRSTLLKNLGDFRGAKADLDAAIALEPNNPGAYSNRGILQWETGNSREALADMDRSIELRSNVAGMYLIRGFIKASLREFPAAFRDIDRAFQLDPNIMNGRIADPEIVDHYIERGRLLADCADLDGALVEFNKAITIGGPVEQFPSSQSGSRRRSLALALGNRGLIWLRKAKETEARKDLAKCLMIDPGTKSWLEDQILNDGLQISLNSISPSQE